MRPSAETDVLITYLYQALIGQKGPVVKDVTRIPTAKYDCYLQSTPTDSLAFSVFYLSNKGELLVDDVERLTASEASLLLFINPEQDWVVAVRNTVANKGKLVRGEPVDRQFKVKLIS